MTTPKNHHRTTRCSAQTEHTSKHPHGQARLMGCLFLNQDFAP